MLHYKLQSSEAIIMKAEGVCHGNNALTVLILTNLNIVSIREDRNFLGKLKDVHVRRLTVWQN